MNVPGDRRFTKDHEWAVLEGSTLRIGITDYAQDALGDVVFVGFPTVGLEVTGGSAFAEVESTKSVSDIYAPLGGSVARVNDELADHPELLNEDPYGEGWLCEITVSDPAAYEGLLSAGDYEALITGS